MIETAVLPVQSLPENQHPDVAYVLDEWTGMKIPLEPAKEDADEAKPAKKPAPRQKAAATIAREKGIA